MRKEQIVDSDNPVLVIFPAYVNIDSIITQWGTIVEDYLLTLVPLLDAGY